MKNKLDREAWLQRSLEVLREEGISGVRIERLARDLNVTKGSFYWHFKGLDDLRQSLLTFWVEQYNDVIMASPEFLDAESAEGLLAAVTRVREAGLDKYELAMRAWADQDKRADQVVREVYETRKAFIGGFFKQLGFRGLDAEVRVRLMLSYLSWEPSMYLDDSESRHKSVLKLLHELLTRRP